MNTQHIAVILALALVLGGCIVPFPAPADKPRFTDEQITALIPGATQRESVGKILGWPSWPADFVRLDGRYWVYTWRQRGEGRVFVVLGGAAVLPISDHQFGLFLRFDERGLLQHRDLVKWRPSSNLDAHMCDDEAICIEHPTLREDMSGIKKLLQDNGSAFTAPGDAGMIHPVSDKCSVVLWLDKEEWTTPSEHAKSLLGSIFEQPPGGINLDYGTQQPTSSPLTSWLPVDAFAVITLLPGERKVRLRNPWEDMGGAPATQAVPFMCVAGAITYVSMGARSKKFGNEFGVIWREVSLETATSQLQGRRQLLLRQQ